MKHLLCAKHLNLSSLALKSLTTWILSHCCNKRITYGIFACTEDVWRKKYHKYMYSDICVCVMEASVTFESLLLQLILFASHWNAFPTQTTNFAKCRPSVADFTRMILLEHFILQVLIRLCKLNIFLKFQRYLWTCTFVWSPRWILKRRTWRLL